VKSPKPKIARPGTLRVKVIGTPTPLSAGLNLVVRDTGSDQDPRMAAIVEHLSAPDARKGRKWKEQARRNLRGGQRGKKEPTLEDVRALKVEQKLGRAAAKERLKAKYGPRKRATIYRRLREIYGPRK
jgi:hypothetical protein